jgi:DNA-binding transcriptional LysR family regulator
MLSLKDINWNQLYYFYEVGKRNSLKEAAKFLGLSSATVSEHIKKLESSFNLTLFNRNKRQLILTEDGEMLFNYAKEMYETGMRLIDNLSHQNPMGGYSVKIGVQDSLSDLKGLQFISEYSDLYAPFGVVNTSRELHGSNLMKDLIEGKFDWILTTQKSNIKDVIYKQIGIYHIEFAVSQATYDQIEDLTELFKTLPLAMSSWDKDTKELITNHLLENHITASEIIESDHFEYCLMLVSRGRCILPLDKSIHKETGWIEDLKFIEFGNGLEIPIYCAWREETSNMVAIQKLRQLVELTDKPVNYDDPELLIRLAQEDDKS